MSDTFDFVVVGGGSGGCTVTSRLTEDPSVSVAMLEAGGVDDNWIINTPAALFLMVGSPINNWHFNTEPQRSMNNRIAYQPRARPRCTGPFWWPAYLLWWPAYLRLLN
jgi:choline dehydrogenase-like flavoprotein